MTRNATFSVVAQNCTSKKVRIQAVLGAVALRRDKRGRPERGKRKVWVAAVELWGRGSEANYYLVSSSLALGGIVRRACLPWRFLASSFEARLKLGGALSMSHLLSNGRLGYAG